MKKLMFVCLIFLFQQGFAQKIVKDHYTVSGGLLGALNYNKFRVTDNDNVSYDGKFGWSAGGWMNFPLGKAVSFEPQVFYTLYSYKSDDLTFLSDGNLDFLSIPLLLKFHLGQKFAITAGPQFDLLTGASDKGANSKDNFTKTSISANVGFELFPHAQFVPFVRYIHGFTDMNDNANPTTAGKFYNQNIQAGVKWRIFGTHVLADSDGDGIVDKNDKCPTVVGLERYQGCPIPDTDGDGINDEVDKCPTVAGIAKYQGCPIPDTDKDGVNDEQDKCPTVAGLAKYNGCPIPDTDKDGVNDEEDKCPTVAGLAKYQGCPIPDTDNDGINDEEDKCPTIAGVAENGGCPLIKFNASNVQFASGTSTLTKNAKTELNKLVPIMNTQYPDVKVSIEGHTDNTGKPEANQKLSENRSAAVKTYLAGKGINADRLSTKGYGADQPIEDNKTAAGKAKNRRVEFKLSQ